MIITLNIAHLFNHRTDHGSSVVEHLPPAWEGTEYFDNGRNGFIQWRSGIKG